MPSLKKRKNSESAKERFEDKYLNVKDTSSPYNLYIPNKADTGKLRELMKSRNYIRIMTQIDKNQFIVLQYYIYAEPDIWMCGDSLTLNQNPDKKIWSKVMCTSRKAYCLCYDESANEFLTICPNCKRLVVMIKDTDFHCKDCDFTLDHDKINDMPFVFMGCKYCPVEIGWERAQMLREVIAKLLQLRSHIVEQNQQKEIESLETELNVKDDDNVS